MANRSIQIEEDLAYQERAWQVQRLGWSVMLLLIIAAAAGLFGEGPLSHASVATDSGLRIDYERFLRYLAPTSLTIRARRDTGQDSIRIRIHGDFFERVKVENIVPEPQEVEIEGQWLSYTFRATTPGEAVIRFDLTAEAIGPLSATISGGNGSPASFRQFVYP